MNAVDTNVLVYAYDERDPKRQRVASHLIESMTDGLLLWQVACEFIAASRRLNPVVFTMKTAWERLFEITSLLQLTLPTPAVLARARDLTTRHQMHYWDAMIIAACLEAGGTRLYSQDVSGESITGLEIIDPFTQIKE